MIEVLSHLGPVVYSLIVDCGSSHVGTVFLHPVVVDVVESVLALAAPVVLRILDVRPTIVGEDGDATIVQAERRVCKQAHLVRLRRRMLVPFSLDRGIVVVTKVPCHNW